MITWNLSKINQPLCQTFQAYFYTKGMYKFGVGCVNMGEIGILTVGVLGLGCGRYWIMSYTQRLHIQI